MTVVVPVSGAEKLEAAYVDARVALVVVASSVRLNAASHVSQNRA